MTETADPKPDYALVYRPRKAYGEKAFDSSAFDDALFIERVTQVLSVFEQGVVIAIDAPWGHGKTHFGLNYSAHLAEKGWKVAYVDAFEHDFMEDPFLLLASTIKSQVKKEKVRKSFVKAASAVGKALLPITAKAIARVATANVLDADNIEELNKAVTDATGNAAEKIIESQLSEFDADRESFAAFRRKLTDLAAEIKKETNNPLVIFIDELDRCRPSFAVRTLERIKHFFEVPNVSFVLLLNREQLERAVKGVYGSEIEAEAYLRKFILYTLALPRHHEKERSDTSDVARYVHYVAGKLALGENQKLVRSFAQALGELARSMRLSLRDVERSYATFVLGIASGPIDDGFMSYFAFVIVLRVKHGDLYRAVLDRAPGAGKRANALLDEARTRGLPEPYTTALVQMLSAHVTGELKGDEATHWRTFLFRYNLSVEQVFRVLARMVDSVPDR